MSNADDQTFSDADTVAERVYRTLTDDRGAGDPTRRLGRRTARLVGDLIELLREKEVVSEDELEGLLRGALSQ